MIEDDEEGYTGRPDWAKASGFTQHTNSIHMNPLSIFVDMSTTQHEFSLEEMQKQALYISPNVLRDLSEIGEGNFSSFTH